MSTFTCICGYVTPKSEEAPEQTGVLISLSELQRLETRIAQSLVEFLLLPEDQRSSWLAENLGSAYPTEVSAVHAAEDIVAGTLNKSSMVAIFRCESCGRIAIADSTSDAWVFFEKRE